MTKTYRPNVAAVVLNSKGEILACHRFDKFVGWQVPQGGIEAGETTLEALYREMQEEIGTQDFEVIGELPTKVTYDWPEHLWRDGYTGQTQTYYLVRLADNASLDLNAGDEPEFDKVEWVTMKEFISRLTGFKGHAYKFAVEEFSKLYPGIIR